MSHPRSEGGNEGRGERAGGVIFPCHPNERVCGHLKAVWRWRDKDTRRMLLLWAVLSPSRHGLGCTAPAFIGAGGTASAPPAHFTADLQSLLAKAAFNSAYRKILHKWLFSWRLCSTSGFGELAAGSLVISLGLAMGDCG